MSPDLLKVLKVFLDGAPLSVAPHICWSQTEAVM